MFFLQRGFASGPQATTLTADFAARATNYPGAWIPGVRAHLAPFPGPMGDPHAGGGCPKRPRIPCRSRDAARQRQSAAGRRSNSKGRTRKSKE